MAESPRNGPRCPLPGTWCYIRRFSTLPDGPAYKSTYQLKQAPLEGDDAADGDLALDRVDESGRGYSEGIWEGSEQSVGWCMQPG